MSNLTLLPDDIRSEFKIDEQGRAFASRRAIARMADVEVSSVVRLLDNISGDAPNIHEIFETIAGQDFEGVALIPDTVVSLIIEYYAYECQERYRTEQAKRVCRAFRAIGFRTWVQSELGWQQPQHKLPQTLPEALRALADAVEAKELAEAEKALLEQENHALAEAVDELFDYSSIIRIAKFNKVSEKLFSWRVLKAMSIKLGKEIKKVPDPRFEVKSLYSHDVWRICYPDYRLPETTTLVINR